MKNLYYLPFLVAIALLPLDAFAQFGPYTENGFGVGGGYTSGENSSVFNLTTGYVFQPEIEAGLTISRSNSDNNDMTVTGIGPYVTFYPVRQDEDFPLSLLLNGSYNFHTFSGSQVDRLESQGGSLSGNTFGVGGGLFHAFDTNGSLSILPFAGVTYSRTKTEISGGGESISNTVDNTSLNLALSFKFGTSGSSSIVVTPNASVGDDNTNFGISASLVFPSESGQ